MATAATCTPLPRSACFAGSGVRIASVATAFPSGRAALDIKLADTPDAVEADTDDMVIRPRRVPAAYPRRVPRRSSPVREASGDTHVKVMLLEPAELQT